ncbi:MAG: WG repeat-containing protein [Lewinellaceae bacterium]|nr:WG repeat-containing protein [Lewinellaceae bacterium]
MKKILPLLLFLIHLAVALPAQVKYLYPVKVGHKWGYIDRKGNMVVAPQYDQVGQSDLPLHGDFHAPRSSGFRLVEVDGKLGLAGRDRQLVLAPDYRQIRVLSGNFFAVRKGDNFVLIDRTGRELFSTGYEDIRLLDTSDVRTAQYFKVGKNNLWGVQAATGEMVLPIRYARVFPLRNGSALFKAQLPGKPWQLLKQGGAPLLPGYYQDIRSYHPDFIAVQTGPKSWETYDSTGKALFKDTWAVVEPLNRFFLELRDSVRYKPRLYSFAAKDTFSFELFYINFYPLDDRYAACELSRNRVGIMDSLGAIVLQPAYDSIAPWTNSVFKVKNRYWGLYDIDTGAEILPCEYSWISGMNNGLALVRKNREMGVINRKMEEIIPPMYEDIRIDSLTVKAYRGREVSLYQVDSTGRVVNVDDYGGVFTLRIGFEGQNLAWQEAGRQKSRPKAASISFVDRYPSMGIPASGWLWSFDNQYTRLWGLRQTGNLADSAWVLPPAFRQVKHILDPGLTMVFSGDQFAVNDFTGTVGVADDRLCLLTLFSHEKGKMITPFAWLGIRRHDFERGFPNAAFIGQDGAFGLTDRKGQAKKGPDGKDLRFSYIGEFVNGYALAVTGGKIRQIRDANQLKYQLESIYNLARKFCLTSVTNQTWRDNLLMLEADDRGAPRWGFIDTSGNWVIQPQYDFAENFDDNGFAEVTKGGLSGIINTNNEVIIPFRHLNVTAFHHFWKTTDRGQTTLLFNRKGWGLNSTAYDRRGDFREGFCKVMKDSLWGFVNEPGAEVIPCRYEQVHDFSEGKAAVLHNGQWHFADTLGNLLFTAAADTLPIDTVFDFHDGLCLFRSRYHYGFLDATGRISIPPVYSRAFDFRNGVARIVDKARTGLINIRGEIILKPGRFERIYPFNELGVAPAMESFRSGLRCLINNRGEALSPVKYREIGDFREGFAVVRTGKQYGLINRYGKEVIPPVYERLGDLSEGLIAARAPNRHNWIFLDTTGKQAFDGAFDWISPFSGGMAFVQINNFDDKTRVMITPDGRQLPRQKDGILFYENGIFGKRTAEPEKKDLDCFFADAKGENLFDRFFQEIEPFDHGVAVVKQAWRKGMINLNGMNVIPYKYASLEKLNEGLYVTRPPGFGLLREDGSPFLAPEYDLIELMDGNLFRVESGENVGYVDLKGNWVWRLGN